MQCNVRGILQAPHVRRGRYVKEGGRRNVVNGAYDNFGFTDVGPGIYVILELGFLAGKTVC